MIKVVFKETYGKYGNDEFTYANFEGIAVGDEVLVNTRYGLALAKVTQIDVKDNRFDEDNLATVVQIVETARARELKEEEKREKERIRAKIAAEARRTKLLKDLRDMVNAEDFEKYVVNMTTGELEELYYAL